MAVSSTQLLVALPTAFPSLDPVLPKEDALFQKDLKQVEESIIAIEQEEEKILAELRSLSTSADAVDEKFMEWKKQIATPRSQISDSTQILEERDKELPFIPEQLNGLIAQELMLQLAKDKYERLETLLSEELYATVLKTTKEAIRAVETSVTPDKSDDAICKHIEEITNQRKLSASSEIAPYTARLIEKLHVQTLKFFLSANEVSKQRVNIQTRISHALLASPIKTKHPEPRSSAPKTLAEQAFDEEVTNYIASFQAVTLNPLFRFKNDDYAFIGWFRKVFANLNISELLDKFEAQAKGIQKLHADIKTSIAHLTTGQFIPRANCKTAVDQVRFYEIVVGKIESEVDAILQSLLLQAGKRHAGLYYAERLRASTSELRHKIAIFKELATLKLLQVKNEVVSSLKIIKTNEKPLHERIQALFTIGCTVRALKPQKTSPLLETFQQSTTSKLERVISHVGQTVLKHAVVTKEAFHALLLLPPDAPHSPRIQELIDTLHAQLEGACTNWLLFSKSDQTSLQLELMIHVLERATGPFKELITHSAIVQNYKKFTPKNYPPALLNDLTALFSNLAIAKAHSGPTPHFLRIFSYGEAFGFLYKIEEESQKNRFSEQDQTTLSELIKLSKTLLHEIRKTDFLPQHIENETVTSTKEPLATVAATTPHLFWLHTFTSLLKALWGIGDDKITAKKRLRLYFKTEKPCQITSYKPAGIEWVVRDFILRTVLEGDKQPLSSFEQERLEEHLTEYLSVPDSREGLRKLHGIELMETVLYHAALSSASLSAKIRAQRGQKGFETWLKAMERGIQGHQDALQKILDEKSCEEGYLETIRALLPPRK